MTPNHKQLAGWDGYSAKGQAIYESIFEQEMAEADAYENRNKTQEEFQLDYEEAAADMEVYNHYNQD